MAATKTDKTETAVNEQDLRIIALSEAVKSEAEGNGMVVERAKLYLAFLKGEDAAND